VVLGAASLVVGQAILSLCDRRRGFRWLSAPVGLAVLLIGGGIAIKLPGHGTTVAITLAALILISLAILGLSPGAPCVRRANSRSRTARTVRNMGAEASAGRQPALALAAAGLALLFASIPFIANGQVGILGVGLVNDDMANHLLIADWLNNRVGQMPALLDQGYPVGPHAVAAGLSEGLDTGLVEAFAGLTLAIPALTSLVAAEALWGLPRGRRVVAAALVSLPYLAAAYVAQEAFKEPIEALFVLSFALFLPQATSPARAVPLGVIAAGAVYAYSFPGLFWLIGTAVIWAAIALVRQGSPREAAWFGRAGVRTGKASERQGPDAAPSPRRLDRGANRRALLLSAGAAIAVLLILTAPEWTRMIDFTNFRAFKGKTISGGLGNLRHQLSPLEALGIWPASDFRLSASVASAPAAAFYLGALIAATALVAGLPTWIRRHGAAIPCALAASAAIYLAALLFGTVYTSAKALAIAAPLITLISLGGLLLREERAGRPDGYRRPLVRSLLAALLAAGISLSSLLVLRQAPVAPTDHADQLASLRPLVQGRKLLFLGRDNFISYELRGARPFTAVRNYYDPNYVKPNLRLADVFRKFDFDSVTPAVLGDFPFVITTRAAYASGPPPGFDPVRKTADFVLWRRTGAVGSRRTLAEGDRPGALLDCARSKDEGIAAAGGIATVFATPPVVGGTWSPGATVEDGSPVSQALTLPSGRWEISIQYDATRPVKVSSPALEATLPANLDYRGSVPFYPVGELTVRRRGPVRFTVAVGRPPLAGRLLGTESEAHLGAIAASPAAASARPLPGAGERRVPVRDACGRYLDWYRPPAGA